MIPVVILTVAALLVLVVITLAALGVIPPNPVAGIRILSVLSSEAGWRAGHRAAILPAAVAVALTAATGLTSLSVPSLAPNAAALATLGLLLPLAWAAIAAHRAAKSV